MTNRIATTREQSDRLLKCGVPAESADMTLRTESGEVNFSRHSLETELKFYEYDDLKRHIEICPAWSLSTLLGLLPKEIYEEETDDSFFFSLAKEFPLSEEYGAAYIPCWDNGDAIVRKRDNSPIEACVQLIEWLMGNGYKLNGIEKGGEE